MKKIDNVLIFVTFTMLTAIFIWSWFWETTDFEWFALLMLYISTTRLLIKDLGV